MLEYYNQFLKTFKVRLKIDWILGLDYFWVWISKKFSEILLLLFDFYWYKLLWIWTLYYVYSISMCTNSKCTTFSAAHKLVYFEGLLYYTPLKQKLEERESSHFSQKSEHQMHNNHLTFLILWSGIQKGAKIGKCYNKIAKNGQNRWSIQKSIHGHKLFIS